MYNSRVSLKRRKNMEMFHRSLADGVEPLREEVKALAAKVEIG